jgi:hypothetical protein
MCVPGCQCWSAWKDAPPQAPSFSSPSLARPALRPPSTTLDCCMSTPGWPCWSVLKSLYSAHTANASWERIQMVITSLMRELNEWATAALPGGSSSPSLDLTPDAQRERLLLEFHYNSTKTPHYSSMSLSARAAHQEPE